MASPSGIIARTGQRASRVAELAEEVRKATPPSSVRRTLPQVNDVGADLADSHLLVQGPSSAYNQTQDNCFGLACEIARRQGYEADPAAVRQIYDNMRQAQLYPPPPQVTPAAQRMMDRWVSRPTQPASTGHIVIRDGDEFMQHASFENYGKEYNYGPAGAEWPIVARIPLRKSPPAPASK